MAGKYRKRAKSFKKERKGRPALREEHLWNCGHLQLQNNTTQRAKLFSPEEKAFEFALHGFSSQLVAFNFSLF